MLNQLIVIHIEYHLKEHQSSNGTEYEHHTSTAQQIRLEGLEAVKKPEKNNLIFTIYSY